eukprot:CAMPEP_0201562084 /NCGR_PEP_ID=MMETSP0173_2-20130828/79139_1 /ASSEMBLY_ACC=CAM_ASM_000268 /TAXON_ID=218659 /ORGANISM="Vexillifera sp., Strain DIVA3 564/2" /LENGTH=135 /DNA_ID=CAMNT_0047976623 /DNA_START=461 /DNA_END=869 /DNA_ORIENTATION=-
MFALMECVEKKLTHLPAYVIDFAVIPNNKESKIKVIELNPFGKMTGPSLFSWEYDRRILQGNVDIWGDLEAYEVKYTPTKLDEALNEKKHVKVLGKSFLTKKEEKYLIDIVKNQHTMYNNGLKVNLLNSQNKEIV